MPALIEEHGRPIEDFACRLIHHIFRYFRMSSYVPPWLEYMA
jgi:hypothetical protein